MKLVAVLNRYENSKEIDLYYMKAIKKFGATPILISEDNLDLLEKCGGILLTGGDNKGALDDYLIKYSFDNKIPLLGICQGMQPSEFGEIINDSNSGEEVQVRILEAMETPQEIIEEVTGKTTGKAK